MRTAARSGAAAGPLLLLLGSAGSCAGPTPAPELAPPVAAAPAAGAASRPAARPNPRLATLVPERREEANRRMSEFFPTRTVARGGEIWRLPPAAQPIGDLRYAFGGARYTIDQFFERNGSTGMVVLHDGKLFYERYREGSDRATRFHSFSVAKSVTATLVGAALRDGHIRSLDDPLTSYVPELAGTAYDGVTIEQALQMSSGVKFSEEYGDRSSDIYRFSMGSMIENRVPANEFMKGLPRVAPPGTSFNYSTGETQVLAWLVREATGRHPAEYLSERVWQRLGMEHDAAWVLDAENGMEIGGIGFNATLRDYARFGALMLRDGVWEGERILPEGWVAAATTPGAPHLAYGALPWGEPEGYGYQWWAIHGPDRSYTAEGVFGQLVYVNPARGVVIAKTSVWPSSWDQELKREAWVAFDAISRHLSP